MADRTFAMVDYRSPDDHVILAQACADKARRILDRAEPGSDRVAVEQGAAWANLAQAYAQIASAQRAGEPVVTIPSGELGGPYGGRD